MAILTISAEARFVRMPSSRLAADVRSSGRRHRPRAGSTSLLVRERPGPDADGFRTRVAHLVGPGDLPIVVLAAQSSDPQVTAAENRRPDPVLMCPRWITPTHRPGAL